MRKKIGYIAILLCCLILSACSETPHKKKSQVYTYHVDKDGQKVVGEVYTPKSNNRDELIQEFIDILRKDPVNDKYRRTIPSNVLISDWQVTDDHTLILIFNQSYTEMKGLDELLSRAAIVKTLCQVEGVDYVEFFIGEQPLINSDGNSVGAMKESSFIDTSKDFNYIQDQKIILYFSNQSGNRLESVSNIVVKYDGSVPMERLVLNQLIKGPEVIKGLTQNVKATIPKGTEYNKITTSNGICTIDFNSAFLKKMDGVEDDVILYSIVNSLVELSTVNKVVFMIDGKSESQFRKIANFDQPFERNFDIVTKEN